MKNIAAIPLLVISLCFPVFVFAETITLKSGKTVEGRVIEKTDKYIKMDLYGVEVTYYPDEIAGMPAAGPGNAGIENSVIAGNQADVYYAQDYQFELKCPQGWMIIDSSQPEQLAKEAGGLAAKTICIFKKDAAQPLPVIYVKSDSLPQEFTFEYYVDTLKRLNLQIQQATPQLKIIENGKIITLGENRCARSITQFPGGAGDETYVYYHFLNGRSSYSVIGSLMSSDLDAYKDLIEATAASLKFKQPLAEAVSSLPPSGLANSQEYFNLGVTSGKKGMLNEAVSNFSKAIEINPKYSEAYDKRAEAYVNLGRYEEALVDYNKVIQITPDYAQAYNNTGFIYFKTGKFEEALNYYRKAAELKKDYADPYNNLGALYLAYGDRQQAMDNYNRALAVDPKNKPANYNLANLYAAKNDYENALFFYRKVIAIDPEDAKSYANIGILLNLLGKKDQAVENFSKATEIFRAQNDLANAEKTEALLNAVKR